MPTTFFGALTKTPMGRLWAQIDNHLTAVKAGSRLSLEPSRFCPAMKENHHKDQATHPPLCDEAGAFRARRDDGRRDPVCYSAYFADIVSSSRHHQHLRRKDELASG